MNGNPEAVITEMGNRIAELERLAIQSNQREQEFRRNELELRSRVDEMARAVIRNQGGNQGGGGGQRDRNISEYTAVLNLRVLTDDRAGRKEWRAKFINVMSQVRPGVRDLLRAMESHRDEVFTEQDFDIAMHDDSYRDRYEEWCQDMWWVLVEKTTGRHCCEFVQWRPGTVWKPTDGCTTGTGSRRILAWQNFGNESFVRYRRNGKRTLKNVLRNGQRPRWNLIG